MFRFPLFAFAAVVLAAAFAAPVHAAAPCATSCSAVARTATALSQARPRALAWRPHVLKIFGRPFSRSKCKG